MDKRCQNLERYQKSMQLNLLYESFCPLQDFYRSLAAQRVNGKPTMAGEKFNIQSRQTAKESNNQATIKFDVPTRQTIVEHDNQPIGSSIGDNKLHGAVNGAQTCNSFYLGSLGQTQRRFKGSTDKQNDKQSFNKQNSLVRDLKKSKKTEFVITEKKKSQLTKKSNVDIILSDPPTSNLNGSRGLQSQFDDSNAKFNSTEACPNDSQITQDVINQNSNQDKDIGKIIKSQKSKQKIKIVKLKPKKLVLNVSMSKYPIIRKIAKYEFNYFISTRDMFAPVNGQIVLDQQASGGTTFVTNGLSRDPEDDYFDIYWMDVSGQRHMDRFAQQKSYQRINHFPGMSIICRKNELGKLLNNMLANFQDQFDFFPKTWVLPRDLRSFETYLEQKKNVNHNYMFGMRKNSIQNESSDKMFIVKPEAACQGKGIFLARDLKDIENYNQGYYQSTSGNETTAQTSAYEQFHCVVQEYIDKPLLIDKMKFDLRLYVLVLGVEPLRIFLFKDGLARLATNEYSKPSEQNMQNMQMHLTNYAINKNSLGFKQNYTAKADFVGSKRSLKFVLRYLKKFFKADTGGLVQQIKDMIIKTIISAQPHLSHQYRSYQHDDYENSMCFEILGFDIMIDDKLNPYLLEVNHAPSFATDSPLDEKIKGQVIYDTLNLLGLSSKRKRNYKNANKMRVDLRRMSMKKANLPVQLREQLRQEFDEMRNQYEFRNKGMYEMIYPILDEITLDPLEDRMRPYQELQLWATAEYCRKNNVKPLHPLPKQKKSLLQQQQSSEQKQKRGATGAGRGQGSHSLQHTAELNSKLRTNYKNIKSRVFDDSNNKKQAKQNQPAPQNEVLEPPCNFSLDMDEDEKIKQLARFLMNGTDESESLQLQNKIRMIHNQILQAPATLNHINELLACDHQLRQHNNNGFTAVTPLNSQIQKSKEELRDLIFQLSDEIVNQGQKEQKQATPTYNSNRKYASRPQSATSTSKKSSLQVIHRGDRQQLKNSHTNQQHNLYGDQFKSYTNGGQFTAKSIAFAAEETRIKMKSQLAMVNSTENLNRGGGNDINFINHVKGIHPAGQYMPDNPMNATAHSKMTGGSNQNQINFDMKTRSFLRRPSATIQSKQTAANNNQLPQTVYQNLQRDHTNGVPILIKSIHLAPSQQQHNQAKFHRESVQNKQLLDKKSQRSAVHGPQSKNSIQRMSQFGGQSSNLSNNAELERSEAEASKGSETINGDTLKRHNTSNMVSRMHKMQNTSKGGDKNQEIELYGKQKLQLNGGNSMMQNSNAEEGQSGAGSWMKAQNDRQNAWKKDPGTQFRLSISHHPGQIDQKQGSSRESPNLKVQDIKKRDIEEGRSFKIGQTLPASLGHQQPNKIDAILTKLPQSQQQSPNKPKPYADRIKGEGVPPQSNAVQLNAKIGQGLQFRMTPQSIRFAAGNVSNSNQMQNTTVKFTYDEIKGGPDGQKGKATVFLLENKKQQPGIQKTTLGGSASPLKFTSIPDPKVNNLKTQNSEAKSGTTLGVFSKPIQQQQKLDVMLPMTQLKPQNGNQIVPFHGQQQQQRSILNIGNGLQGSEPIPQNKVSMFDVGKTTQVKPLPGAQLIQPKTGAMILSHQKYKVIPGAENNPTNNSSQTSAQNTTISNLSSQQASSKQPPYSSFLPSQHHTSMSRLPPPTAHSSQHFLQATGAAPNQVATTPQHTKGAAKEQVTPSPIKSFLPTAISTQKGHATSASVGSDIVLQGQSSNTIPIKIGSTTQVSPFKVEQPKAPIANNANELNFRKQLIEEIRESRK